MHWNVRDRRLHEQNERRDGRVVWAFACAARFTAMIRSAVVTRVRSLAARGLAAGLLAAVAACLALPLQAVTLVNNIVYSINGINHVIPEPGLFRNRCLGSRLSLQCRVPNA